MIDGSASEQATVARRATLLGVGAVGLWASLAALTVSTGNLPPFQLTALAFAGGTIVGLVSMWIRGRSLGTLAAVPGGAWALGVYGLLGYHVCYFAALRHAPPLEASLVNYVWPLLIVVFAGLLPRALGGRPIGVRQVLGAVIGFAGTAVVLLGGGGRIGFDGAPSGYLFALAAGLVWSSYSVASRLYARVPSDAVTGFCAATAAGAALVSAVTEIQVWPHTAGPWLAIAGLGLGPLGLAFYLWDEGMKRGDIVRLGLASYATPLLSTIVLAATGLGTLSPLLVVAAFLVTAGALIAGGGRT